MSKTEKGLCAILLILAGLQMLSLVRIMYDTAKYEELLGRLSNLSIVTTDESPHGWFPPGFKAPPGWVLYDNGKQVEEGPEHITITPPPMEPPMSREQGICK